MDQQQMAEAMAKMAEAQQGPGAGFWLFIIVVNVFFMATMWKIFTKAGQPGWAAIVPIYNAVVLLQISGKPVWWLVLFLIPLVNFVFAILLLIALAEAFGKGPGFAAGLLLLGIVFFPILAFGSSEYRGQAAKPA